MDDETDDELVTCVIAGEEAVSPEELNDDQAFEAARLAVAALPAAWQSSRSAVALLRVGELVTPIRDIVRAAYACAQLAQGAAPCADPDVVRALDALGRWLDGACDDAERARWARALTKYNGRASTPAAAWAVYCACCVESTPTMNGWFYAHGASGAAESALRAAGHADPVGMVASTVRAYLMAPTVDQLAAAITRDNFSIP